jgi:hypothetical protein
MSGRSSVRANAHPIPVKTSATQTRAQSQRNTHARKLGQNIFAGERIYSINSLTPAASIASISHSSRSTSLSERISIFDFLEAGILLICVFSLTDFSIGEGKLHFDFTEKTETRKPICKKKIFP